MDKRTLNFVLIGFTLVGMPFKNAVADEYSDKIEIRGNTPELSLIYLDGRFELTYRNNSKKRQEVSHVPVPLKIYAPSEPSSLYIEDWTKYHHSSGPYQPGIIHIRTVYPYEVLKSRWWAEDIKISHMRFPFDPGVLPSGIEFLPEFIMRKKKVIVFPETRIYKGHDRKINHEIGIAFKLHREEEHRYIFDFYLGRSTNGFLYAKNTPDGIYRFFLRTNGVEYAIVHRDWPMYQNEMKMSYKGCRGSSVTEIRLRDFRVWLPEGLTHLSNALKDCKETDSLVIRLDPDCCNGSDDVVIELGIKNGRVQMPPRKQLKTIKF